STSTTTVLLTAGQGPLVGKPYWKDQVPPPACCGLKMLAVSAPLLPRSVQVPPVCACGPSRGQRSSSVCDRQALAVAFWPGLACGVTEMLSTAVSLRQGAMPGITCV